MFGCCPPIPSLAWLVLGELALDHLNLASKRIPMNKLVHEYPCRGINKCMHITLELETQIEISPIEIYYIYIYIFNIVDDDPPPKPYIYI